jgi:hypothetical protein
MDDIQSAVKRLIEKHAGLRAAGRAVGIDPAYLSRLRCGKKSNPGADILRKLGIKRETKYVRWYRE